MITCVEKIQEIIQCQIDRHEQELNDLTLRDLWYRNSVKGQNISLRDEYVLEVLKDIQEQIDSITEK